MPTLKLLANTSVYIPLLNFNQRIMKKTHLFQAILLLCLIVPILQSCQKEQLHLSNPSINELFLQKQSTEPIFLEIPTRLSNTNFCPFEQWQLEKVIIPDEIVTDYANHIKEQTATTIINFPSSPIGQPNWAQSFKVIEQIDTPIYITALVTPKITFPIGFVIIFKKEQQYQFFKIGNPSYFFYCINGLIP